MYIGENKLNGERVIDKTPGGIDILEVEYENGDKEVFSKLMYDAIKTDEPIDLTKLREKRIYPIVGSVLMILREWGIKLDELNYFSAILNQSLETNEKEALKYLYQKWSPTIKSHDEIDLITIDRILKSKNNESIPSPYQDK